MHGVDQLPCVAEGAALADAVGATHPAGVEEPGAAAMALEPAFASNLKVSRHCVDVLDWCALLLVSVPHSGELELAWATQTLMTTQMLHTFGPQAWRPTSRRNRMGAWPRTSSPPWSCPLSHGRIHGLQQLKTCSYGEVRVPDGPPKQAEKVACGSVMPISVPATLAV